MELTLEQRQLLYARSAGFSGVDISATTHMPAISMSQPNLNHSPSEDNLGKVYELGSIQTLSYSVYTAKSPVKSLGFRNVINTTRGTRTIAGTMIFNQLYNHPFEDRGAISLIDPRMGGVLSYSSGDVDYYRNSDLNFELPDSVLAPQVSKRHMYDFTWDQRNMGRRIHPSDMPKFDIICTFVNESGNIGKMIIYGIDLVHESSVLSIEDIYTEVTYQYVAQDIEYFHAEGFTQAQEWRSTVLLGDTGSEEVTQDDAHLAQRNAIRSILKRGLEAGR